MWLIIYNYNCLIIVLILFNDHIKNNFDRNREKRCNFSIYFSTLEFKIGRNVSMAMKIILKQNHFCTGRKLAQMKFLVEDGQTWFMKWQKTVSEGAIVCNCVYHCSPKLEGTEERQIFFWLIRRITSVAFVKWL